LQHDVAVTFSSATIAEVRSPKPSVDVNTADVVDMSFKTPDAEGDSSLKPIYDRTIPPKV
jgi:hypothetical protein